MEALLAAMFASMSAVFASSAATSRADAVVAQRAGVALGRRSHSRASLRHTLSSIGSSSLVRRVSGADRVARMLDVLHSSDTIDEVLGAKAALGSLGLFIGFVSPAPLLAPIVAIGAFRAPDMILAVRVGRRLTSIDQELPQFLDLLGAASLAGLAGPLAIRRAVEALEGPLEEELRAVLRAVDLGARWRDELRALAGSLGLRDLRRAAGALTRTESLGASLADSMTELAAQVRSERRAAVTERARKAPVKMLFPLVFLVLPAFLLLTVVPVLLTTLQSIR